MEPAATLGAYAAALAVVFAAAVGVGSAVGPVGTAAASGASAPAGHDGHGAGEEDAGLLPGGLAVAQDGYSLDLAGATLAAGRPTALQLVISGPDGQVVTEYTPTHDRELHLVVVRRDLTGYQHLHPERDAEGRWTVPLTLPQAGPYKVFADFVPAGRDRPLTLAADLTAPGVYTPTPLPARSSRASVDGYDVELDGRLVAGTRSPLALEISKDGRPVTDLQPYLGAYGHLVALRAGDLAYLHVHPRGELDDPATRPGPEIRFDVDVPSASTYRLFLDFSHGGTVRTAAATAVATQAAHGH